ncbi:hypothetical protein CsSME_00031271 [Camellia sinensis var. sinensis]
MSGRIAQYAMGMSNYAVKINWGVSFYHGIWH